MQLQREFLKLFLISVLVVVAINLVRAQAEQRSSAANELALHLADWRAETQRWLRGLGEVLITEGTPDSVEIMLAGRQEAGRHLRALVREHGEVEAWSPIEARWARLVEHSEAFAIPRSMFVRSVDAHVAYGRLSGDLADMLADIEAILASARQHSAQAQRAARWVGHAVLVLALGWVMYAFWRAARLMIAPLQRLTTQFRRLAEDHPDWRAQIGSVRDELARWRAAPAAAPRLSEIALLVEAGIGMLSRLGRQAARAERYARIVKLRSERHAHQASHDALTGLYNRGHLLSTLASLTRRADADGRDFALLFIDLDYFKDVNDTYGHRAGDRVLVEVAKRLGRCVRQRDLVCRLGGDEFAVVVVGYDSDKQLAQLARRLMGEVAEPFVVEGNSVRLGCSIGIALCPVHAQDPGELMQLADIAMYEAKGAGRNEHRFYGGDIRARISARARRTERLRRALETGEGLELVYQPQFRLAPDGAAVPLRAEALLRWSDAQLGPVSPAEFVPLAEELGLIGALGGYVMEGACAQLRQWREQGIACERVAVNVSSLELLEGGFAERVLDALARNALPPGALEIEITERLLVGGDAVTRDNLRRLKNAGVRFGIDDFGTGYSSLGYLRHVEFDVIKIDRSLIDGLASDPTHRLVVDAILAMGQAFGAELLAEGVEQPEDLAYLQAVGFDWAQGYLLARPLHPAAAAAVLGRHCRQGDDPAPDAGGLLGEHSGA